MGMSFLKLLFSVNLLFASGVNQNFLDASDTEFKNALEGSTSNFSDWIQNLDSQPYTLLCLGETHNSKFRNFYAEHFFSKYKLDKLFLEATPEQVEGFLNDIKVGKEKTDLLSTDILKVLRAALKINPNLKILGVEQTQRQKRIVQDELIKKGRTSLTRESFIAQNTIDQITPGERHAMLYGSLHCAESDLGLGNNTPAFTLLKRVLPKNSTKAVRTFFRRDIKPFTAILSYLDLEKNTLVFTETKKLDPKFYNFNWTVKKIFLNYDDVIFVER